MTYSLFFRRSYADRPCRIIDKEDKGGVWWDDGVPLDPAPAEVTASFRPFESDDPDMSEEVSAFYNRRLPLMRKDLVEALVEAGAQLEVVPARIHDPDDDSWRTDFLAVNILGLVAAVDLKASELSLHPGDAPEINAGINSLVVDEAAVPEGLLMFRLKEKNSVILVHDRIRRHLEEQGFSDVVFPAFDEVAL